MGGDETLPRRPAASGPRIVAGRYTLERRIGSGGHGEVWAARDAVDGGQVAVKLLRPFGQDDDAWMRREIATMRMLRLPGVVRLLDEGVDGARTFIVMELLEGRPFPGVSAPAPWTALEPATLALLDVLARLHAEGVVHRDLKPDNVLVDASGHPTILDFGIATATYVPDRLTRDGLYVGTPAYLAPEQFMGERATAASDLYSVGVMLFEALTGRMPHEAPSWQGLLMVRLSSPAPPVSSAARDVPEEVAATIDWLLRREPEARPASAAEVLRALRHEPQEVQELPFVGRDALIERIASTLAKGEPFRLAGGPGMGKTRTAREVASLLGSRGRTICWIRPGEGPYSALVPLVGSLDGLRTQPVDRVRRHVRACVREAIDAGTIFVVDDSDRLDRSSARLLASLARRAPILTVSSRQGAAGRRADAVLASLSTSDLEEGLFAGSNRLFHLREDAARELHRRTNGVPARIAGEVRGWLRSGLARRMGGRLALERGSIERLTADLVPLAVDALRPRVEHRHSDLHEELLAWIELADGAASDELLARVIGRPAWEIDADLDELVDTGACGRGSSANVVALEGSRLLGAWSLTERRAAHERLAGELRPGTPARLRHLVLARSERGHEIVLESLRLAEGWAAEGELGRAAVALAEGCSVARSIDPLPLDEMGRLLRLWVAVALFDGSTGAIDRVLYELGRGTDVPDRSAMAALARAALAVRASSSGCAELAEAVPVLREPRLERLRQATRVLAARLRPVEEEERVVDELRGWAASVRGDPFVAGSLAAWEGKVRYRQGRFAEAIPLQLEAAAHAEWPIDRISAVLHAAVAAFDDFDLERALELAETARRDAAACRHVYLEGRAEWLVRWASYRLERKLEPDPELVDLAGRVAQDLEALCALCESAIAYRVGDRALAASLAARARTIWMAAGGKPPGLVLASALAHACGAGEDGPAPDRLVEWISACPAPRIALQAAALLATTGIASLDAARADGLAATVPEARWKTRLEVLSIAEARALLTTGR